MMLLSNGNVLVQNGAGASWMQLQPDSSGSYAKGTWPANLASTMPTGPEGFAARSAFDSTVLPDGRIFSLGGEWSGPKQEFLASGLIYDPTATDPATGHLGPGP